MRTQCPHCATFYNIKDELSGKKTQCKKCDVIFVIEEIMNLEAIEEIVDLDIAEEAVHQADKIQKQPEVAAHPTEEAPLQVPKANQKKLGILGWLGLIVVILTMIGFFINSKTKKTDKAGTAVSTQAPTLNATKNTETPMVDIPRYDKEFNYDVEKIILRKFNYLKDKKDIRFEKSLCTKDTYVFSWRDDSGKKVYTLLNAAGEVMASPNIKFEKITKNHNVLVCEIGVNSNYRAGERIYYIENGNILLEIENFEQKDLVGKLRRKIERANSVMSFSSLFFGIAIDDNFIKRVDDERRTNFIINDKGRVVYQYDMNKKHVTIINNIAIISGTRKTDKDTVATDIVNLFTSKITKTIPVANTGPVFRYKNLIGVIRGDKYFLVDNFGNIVREEKVNFLVNEKIDHDNDYERLTTFLDVDAFFIYKKNGKFGLKDFERSVLSDAVFPSEDAAKYAYATRSHNSIDVPYSFLDDKNKWQYITHNGKLIENIDGMLWSAWATPSGFSENLASAGFFLKDNKTPFYGYFNHQFEWVIPPIFDLVTPFRNGKALVQYRGEWLLIGNPASSSPKADQAPPSNTIAQTQTVDVSKPTSNAMTDAEYKALLENQEFKKVEQYMAETYKAYLAASKNDAEKNERIQDQRQWITMRDAESAKRFKKGSPAYVQFLIDWATHRDHVLHRLIDGNLASIKADGYFYTLDYDNISYDGVIKPEHRLRGNDAQTIVTERSGQAAVDEAAAIVSFVSSFYDKYLKLDSSVELVEWLRQQPEVDAAFVKAIEKLIKEDSLDYNPILMAQDVPNSMQYEQRPVIDGSSAELIAYTLWGSEKSPLCVLLIKKDSAWRITGVLDMNGVLGHEENRACGGMQSGGTASQGASSILREITLTTGVKNIIPSGGLWILTGKTGETLKFNASSEAGNKLFSVCASTQYTCTIRAKVDKDNVLQELLSLESTSPMLRVFNNIKSQGTTNKTRSQSATPVTVSPQIATVASQAPQTQKTDISKLDVTELQKLADQGNAEAQFYLGVRYENGRGISKDIRKAVEWYQKAAAQGDAGSQRKVGNIMVVRLSCKA